ncbi:GNAT family N-acetyltransferase [Thermobrachium celere]|uniref:Acetyltransferase (GNAT) family protein n=1 Tax=Thermobrachium celere DSM 8682 TaxID=941824 RepID=R7RSY4_9CLOT|nr:GNAT family N-acetyltransferase [Thermobrachium celere]CDF59144.1 Acetyltransferase (GNAT) family protein [Thermobrachium celere DSM 8682]
MNYIIRPIRFEDAEDVNEMRRMDGVRETILGIKSERINKTEDFIKNLGPNDYVFVAEVNNNGVRKVVGVVGLHVNSNPRCRHSASIGIMVHKDYQGMGIGKALLEEVLDLADNWLKLVRVELCVFVDNDRAINLYESLGFQIEGTKKYAAIKNGKYVDEYLMARYNI